MEREFCGLMGSGMLEVLTVLNSVEPYLHTFIYCTKNITFNFVVK